MKFCCIHRWAKINGLLLELVKSSYMFFVTLYFLRQLCNGTQKGYPKNLLHFIALLLKSEKLVKINVQRDENLGGKVSVFS